MHQARGENTLRPRRLDTARAEEEEQTAAELVSRAVDVALVTEQRENKQLASRLIHNSLEAALSNVALADHHTHDPPDPRYKVSVGKADGHFQAAVAYIITPSAPTALREQGAVEGRAREGGAREGGAWPVVEKEGGQAAGADGTAEAPSLDDSLAMDDVLSIVHRQSSTAKIEGNLSRSGTAKLERAETSRMELVQWVQAIERTPHLESIIRKLRADTSKSNNLSFIRSLLYTCLSLAEGSSSELLDALTEELWRGTGSHPFTYQSYHPIHHPTPSYTILLMMTWQARTRRGRHSKRRPPRPYSAAFAAIRLVRLSTLGPPSPRTPKSEHARARPIPFLNCPFPTDL